MIVNFNWQQHKLILIGAICGVAAIVAIIALLNKPEPPPPQTPEDVVKNALSTFLQANESVAVAALAGYNTSMAMIELCGVGEEEAGQIRAAIGPEIRKLENGLSDKAKDDLERDEKAFKKEWEAKSEEQRKQECAALGKKDDWP